jgi:alpha-mannosidase
MEQRALKESYAWEASRRTASLGESAMGLLQSMFKKEQEPSLIVFNTLNWKRSGVATVYIDHQIIPRGKKAGIYDNEGKRLASQPVSSRSDGTYWAVWVNDIPAFGYKKFLIRPEDETAKSGPSHPDDILENAWYRIQTDNTRGTVRSLYDKELSLELVDPEAQYSMGEFILEQLGNRSQMESKMLNDFKRSPLDTVWFDSVTMGEVWNSIRFYGESETAISPRGFSFEIRLYNTEKRIDLVCSIIKKSITDPESFYIAFPFAVRNGKHFTEVAGGVIETGRDQIRGSSNDWYTVQNFTAVRNDEMQVVFGCGEMPLMQFGAINTGRYEAGAMPQTTHLFSWPMNNYWVTNFNADQRGGHSWTYYLTSTGDNSDNGAARFGWGARVPLLTRIIPGDGPGDSLREGSFITGWPSNVIVISTRPDEVGKTVIIHLRETGGEETNLSLTNGISGQPLTVTEVDVTGSPVSNPSTKIGRLESKFYRVTLR